MSMAAPPLVNVAEIPGRGRALVASRDIMPGEVILSDSPLLLYPASSASSSSSCSRCFRTIRSVPVPCPTCCSPGGGGEALFCSPQCLAQAQASSSHSPWACQALSRLRSLPTPLDPDLFSQAHFLITAYSLSATADFPRLLSLQGAELGAVTEAPALHSLLSSLSPHSTPPGFSLELTAALLAKDKMNAFGIMEPFREEDGGQRRVRAYGIYPNASLFNHDCLPNACRFDYIDADTERNTDILVRAIHDIPAGREVCLSYFPVNWRYAERQRRLLEDYGFRCVCDRCEVEKNWKDDEEDDEGMEEEEDDGNDDNGMEDDNSGAGEDGDSDFPHAYFFLRYQCDRESCGGTMAPLPPSPQGKLSDEIECNACGQLRKADDINAENAEVGDGEMLDE